MLRAPNACDTSVSRPSSTPMPKMAKAMCIALPTPAALIACGPSGPTMMVSTTPMAIQPSSAITTGTAMRSIGKSSRRMDGYMAGGEEKNSSISAGRAMRTLAVTVLLGVVSHAQIGNQPGSGFHTLLSSAMRYVINYEQQFALLVLEEHYTQELQRRPSDGTTISRSDPGGTISQQTLRSDYLLVQLGMDGEGWMP